MRESFFVSEIRRWFFYWVPLKRAPVAGGGGVGPVLMKKKTFLSCSCLSWICTWSNFNIFRMWKTLPHIKPRKKAPAERGHSGWRITSLTVVICEFGKISQLFSAALFSLTVTFCPRWSARIKQLFTHLLFHFSALTLKKIALVYTYECIWCIFMGPRFQDIWSILSKKMSFNWKLWGTSVMEHGADIRHQMLKLRNVLA